MYSLIVTAKMNDVDPQAWLADRGHPAEDAFGELPAGKADNEMLDLALHIIEKKAGRFDPEKFDDRYDAAVRGEARRQPESDRTASHSLNLDGPGTTG
jgi:hypothetical protein